MAAVQSSFSLRTSANVKTVHLLGSWDNYSGQLPLSKDTKSGKAGAWKGTFRFQGATLKPGQRYWYYYMLDGYSVSHDPAKSYTKEPTTGRFLNILDVPAMNPAKDLQLQIPQGRGISPSRIACPKPSKPYASRKVREADYTHSPVDSDDITSRLEAASLYSAGSASPSGSVSSGFSSGRSSGPDSPASLSSLSYSSNSSCRCNRWGITRSGKRVLMDCGGRRCGYSDDSSSCDSESESDFDSSDEEEEVERPVIKTIAPKRTTAAPARRTAATSSSRRR